jgi:hypothetical protein
VTDRRLRPFAASDSLEVPLAFEEDEPVKNLKNRDRRWETSFVLFVTTLVELGGLWEFEDLYSWPTPVVLTICR